MYAILRNCKKKTKKRKNQHRITHLRNTHKNIGQVDTPANEDYTKITKMLDEYCGHVGMPHPSQKDPNDPANSPGGGED